MALFKILKGQEKNLPANKTEGWAYVTTDEGNMYVDVSASKRVRIGAHADKADVATKAEGDTESIRAKYLAKLKQVTSNGTTFTFRGETGDGSDAADLITIPLAGDKAGLISNAAQTIKGEKTFANGIKFPDVTSTTYPAVSTGLTWSGSTDGAKIYYEVQASDKGMLIIEARDDTNAGAIFRNSSSKKEVSIINGLVTGAFKGNLTGTADYADKAKGDSTSIRTTYIHKIKQVTSNGTTFTFRGEYGDGSDANDLITIPNASASVAGLITNAAQTVAGTKTLQGNIIIKPGALSNHQEGLRILNADNGWTTLILGGTVTSGTSTSSWSLHTNGGKFYLTHNGNPDSSTGILQSDANGNWRIDNTLGIGGKNAAYKLYVNGTSYFDNIVTFAGNNVLSADNTYFSGSSSLRWKGIYATNFYGYLDGTAKNADMLDDWHQSYFYNENMGHRWYHLAMNNTMTDRTGFYKIADIKMQSGYGSYSAAKIVGYLYDHNGNWEQSQTYKIPFQAIINITGDGASLYSTVTADSNHIRIVKMGTRSYELQVRCNQQHCDFDVFYQVVGDAGVTSYETLVAGSTPPSDDAIIKISQAESYGNHAFKADRATGDSDSIRNLYISTIKQVTSNGTTFSFRGYNGAGSERADLITVPNASTTVAGLITTEAQSLKGNKNLDGQLTIQPANFSGSASDKQALRVIQNHQSGGGVNSSAVVFSHVYGTHDYGVVENVNIQSTSGDKPSIRFSVGAYQGSTMTSGTTSWSIGYCYSSGYDFRISKNHGWNGWGTEVFRLDTNGNAHFAYNIYDKNAQELRANLFIASLFQKTSNGTTFTFGGKNTAGTELSTLTIPNASETIAGLITNTDQSFDGTKRFNKALTLGAWTASIKCATWSRLCYIPYNANTSGSSYIITIQATRGNVVYNSTYSVNVSHNNAGTITCLSNTKYSDIKVRIVVNKPGDSYFEIYDTAYGATASTTQSVLCRIVGISTGAITKYTAFTDGTTVPSGFSVADTLDTIASRGGLQTQFITSTNLKSTYVGVNGQNLAYKLYVNGQSAFEDTIWVFKSSGTAAVFGGTVSSISSAVYAPTTGIQLCAGGGGNTNSTAIGFHNPGISSSVFGYYQTNADVGSFRYASDDARFWILHGGTAVQTSGTSSWGKGTTVIGADGVDKIIIGNLQSTIKGATIGGHNSALSAWAPLHISGTELHFYKNETRVAKMIDGCLSLFPLNSDYREGIRIHSYGSWADILLCGNENTGDTGTSANSWFIGNNNGNFYLTRNGSTSSSTAMLSCKDNYWEADKLFGVNGRNSTYTFYVNGTTGFNGSVDLDGVLLVKTNNTWLSPSRVQIGRPDTTAYTDRSVIGTTDGNLHIDSYKGYGVYINHYSGKDKSDGSQGTMFSPNGNVNIGTASDKGYKLYVNGNGYFTGNVNIVTNSQPQLNITGVAGNWTYIRLHNGSNLWDIATLSTNFGGGLQFRAGGGDGNRTIINHNGRWDIYSTQGQNNSICLWSNNGESSISYRDKDGTYTSWTVGRGPGGIGSTFGWWNGSRNVMTLGNDGYLTLRPGINSEMVIAGKWMPGSAVTGNQDGNDRPGLRIFGDYPQMVLMSGGASNPNHGATISLGGFDSATATSGAFKMFTIGTPGYNVTFMDVGYGTSINPHNNGMNAYGGYRIMRFNSDGTVQTYNRFDACNRSNSASYMESAIQIRERSFGGAQDDTWATAPRLSWHWAGRVQCQIALASNGYLYWSSNQFSNAYQLAMADGRSYNLQAAGLYQEIANDKLPARLRVNTSPTNANPDTFKQSGFYYCATGTMPSNISDANIISINHTNGGWGHQLAFKFGGGGVTGAGYDGKDVYTRLYNSSSGTWTPWYAFLSSGNYTAYTVTKTGEGASGTWGISITGNAAALTTSAGNAGQPVYFSGGKPVAIDWHIGNSGTGEHNCNNVTYNFCGYYNSNGPANLGNSTTDGALYAQAYSSSWVGQIAQDYRNGNLFIRGKNNGTWQPWKAILTSDYRPMVFHWSGQSGQPTWLWGGNDGLNMYVYNPSNFNVNSAKYLNNPRNSNADMNTWNYGSSTMYSREDSGGSVSNCPSTGVWWQTLCQHSPDTNYGNQLAQQMTGGVSAYIRSYQGGIWSAWYRLWRQGDAVTSAVWNDYAECRKSDSQESGYVMFEKGDDSLSKTIERLQHFAGIVSDTWGFSQGETADAKTNIAVAGRVLAYPYRDRNEYKPGDCVCAAPGGKVDIMTREEIVQYPDRIVGTVSCVPEYEEWGGGEGADRNPVKVNGRIWIKVK